MKFYGKGVVWDAENNKRLCKFVGGAVETEDERVRSILIERGYKYDGDLPEPKDPHGVTSVVCNECGHEWVAVFSDKTPISILQCPGCGAQNTSKWTESDEPPKIEPVTPDLGAKKLRELGKELELTFSANMSKIDMAKAINEARK